MLANDKTSKNWKKKKKKKSLVTNDGNDKEKFSILFAPTLFFHEPTFGTCNEAVLVHKRSMH
jgi:hypothetical protein